MATTKLWTVAELERTSLAGRFELIDGEMVEMAPSGGDASGIGVTVASLLFNHVRPRGLGRVFGADGRFVLYHDRELIRVPDVAFVRGERLTPVG